MARENICKKGFVLKDGSETRHADPNAVTAVFAFTNGTTLTVPIKDLSKETLVAATAHGLSQKVGDSFAGSKTAVAKGEATDPVAWAIEQAEAMIDNLVNGVWITVREGAGVPRISMLVEAIVAAAAQKGKKADPAVVKEKLKDEATRKGAMLDDDIATEFARIRDERDAAKRARAKESGAAVGVETFA